MPAARLSSGLRQLDLGHCSSLQCYPWLAVMRFQTGGLGRLLDDELSNYPRNSFNELVTVFIFILCPVAIWICSCLWSSISPQPRWRLEKKRPVHPRVCWFPSSQFFSLGYLNGNQLFIFQNQKNSFYAYTLLVLLYFSFKINSFISIIQFFVEHNIRIQIEVVFRSC